MTRRGLRSESQSEREDHDFPPAPSFPSPALSGEGAMPTNKTWVQQWLGLVAQFGKHIDPHVLNEIRAVWSPITGEKKTIEDIPEIDRARSFELMKEAVANINHCTQFQKTIIFC